LITSPQVRDEIYVLRPLQVVIEIYRKAEITEALWAFKKIYLEVVDQLIDHLTGQESDDSSR